MLAVGCGFEKWDVRDAVQMAGKEVEEAKANVQVRFWLSDWNVPAGDVLAVA